MTRFVPVTVLLVLLVQSGVAGAQTTSPDTFPSGATISFEKREIFDPTSTATDKFIQANVGDTKLLQYFNLAQCTCAKQHASEADPAMGTHIGNVRYLVKLANGTATGLTGTNTVDYWVGTSCDNDMTRTGAGTTCALIDTTENVDNSLGARGGETHEFNLYTVINAKAGGACIQANSVTAPIWTFVRYPGSQTGTYDFKKSFVVGQQSTEAAGTVTVDTQPPPLPDDADANPGEGTIELSWTPPASGSTEIAYYQALCALNDGMDTPVRDAPTNSPQYVMTQRTCPGIASTEIDASETPTATALSNADEKTVSAPTGAFAALDPKYICGQENGAASGLSIRGLQNDTAYKVILVAVDLHGNFRATYFTQTITPHLVTDFWEDLHERNKQLEGGLCLLAETYGDDSALTRTLRAFRDDTLGGSRFGRWLGDAYYATLARLGSVVHSSMALRVVAAIVLAPAVLLALLWHWLSLPGLLALIAAAWWARRHRVTRRWRSLTWLRVPAVAAIAILSGANPAHADGGFQPYWQNSDIEDESKNELQPGDPGLVEWHAGIRLSPYVPDVDGKIATTAGAPGPYEQMFGGYHMLPMLDVERIVWTGFGQVGFGGSAGYWQKTARAFTKMSMAGQADRPREPGARNAFRLIPLQLNATYRLTMLDDMYGVPIVPYVRGGLAYYIWWITAPNGNYARICDDNGEMCGNKALGASLGVQASIGLSIRAERIDASTAMSMRNSGIQHAGIYAELSAAKVDGFGSEKKLSVGATTWFAGVDFEF